MWCRTVGQTDDRVVTADKYRGIRQAFWAEDSTTLLYMQDDAGDENFHLFAIDATSASGAARDLTPYKGAKVRVVTVACGLAEGVTVASRRTRAPRCRTSTVTTLLPHHYRTTTSTTTVP